MATEVLSPNAAGSSSELTPSPLVVNYLNVDEYPTPDDDITYVRQDGADTEIDFYGVPNSGVGMGLINSVTVYFRTFHVNSTGSGYAGIRTGGTNYYGDAETNLADWTTYSKTWATNPDTSNAWTWAEINAMEIGAKCVGVNAKHSIRVTQVYAVVDYTPAAGGGQIAAKLAAGGFI